METTVDFYADSKKAKQAAASEGAKHDADSKEKHEGHEGLWAGGEEPVEDTKAEEAVEDTEPEDADEDAVAKNDNGTLIDSDNEDAENAGEDDQPDNISRDSSTAWYDVRTPRTIPDDATIVTVPSYGLDERESIDSKPPTRAMQYATRLPTRHVTLISTARSSTDPSPIVPPLAPPTYRAPTIDCMAAATTEHDRNDEDHDDEMAPLCSCSSESGENIHDRVVSEDGDSSEEENAEELSTLEALHLWMRSRKMMKEEEKEKTKMKSPPPPPEPSKDQRRKKGKSPKTKFVETANPDEESEVMAERAAFYLERQDWLEKQKLEEKTLKELRELVRTWKIPNIATNIGGHNKRTKQEFIRDIKDGFEALAVDEWCEMRAQRKVREKNALKTTGRCEYRCHMNKDVWAKCPDRCAKAAAHKDRCQCERPVTDTHRLARSNEWKPKERIPLESQWQCAECSRLNSKDDAKCVACSSTSERLRRGKKEHKSGKEALAAQSTTPTARPASTARTLRSGAGSRSELSSTLPSMHLE